MPGSIAIFADETVARVLRALRSPATTGKEPGAMTTVFARSKLDVFGVSTAFVVRKISLSDLGNALRLGWEDFKAIPTHAVVLCVIYPVLGIVLFRLVIGYSVLPLLFPLAAGFTLIGPFAALGLYELSRRRERGEEAAAWDAMHVLRAPSFGAMLELGTLLLVLFGVLDRRRGRDLHCNLRPRSGCTHP
ncbi:putative membrane protein [Bradyrhizobium sp. GM5.1]